MTQNTLELLLAAAPILALVGMLICRVRTAYAALIAIVVALVCFPVFPLTGEALGQQVHSLAASTAAVVFIMLGGILVSQMLEVSGAQEKISDWLAQAARTRTRTILLLGLGVAPLVESIIGFGVGVVTTVPLLLRAGLSPTKAATISLLGIIMAPWGSMGPGMLIAASLSHVSLTEFGTWGAVFNLPVQLVMGISIALVGVGFRKTLRQLPELLLVTALMWGSLIAVNLWVMPALAGIVSSAVGIATLLVLARITGGSLPSMDAATRRAFMPYALLIACMLCVVALAAVVKWGSWEHVLTSPGLWIMVTACVTPLILRMGGIDTGFSIRQGLRTWFPACSVTLLFIVFGSLLAANGMSTSLAEGAAKLGSAFVVLLPVVGALAGYVTNSNSGSAALLTSGITQTTHALNANLGAALGVQNVATGAAIMVCPARVALAESMANAESGPGTAGPDLQAKEGPTSGLGSGEPGAQEWPTPEAAPERVNTGWLMRVVLLANVVVLAILTPLTAWLLHA